MAAPLSCDPCEEMLADYLLHALEPEVVQAVTEYPAPMYAVGRSLRPLKLSWPTPRKGCCSAPPRGAQLAPAGRGHRRGSVHSLVSL
jgi:hypothetical protein